MDTDKEERLREYRRLAAAAIRKAERASSPELRRSYLNLAEGWDLLGDQIERSFRAVGTKLVRERLRLSKHH